MDFSPRIDEEFMVNFGGTLDTMDVQEDETKVHSRMGDFTLKQL